MRTNTSWSFKTLLRNSPQKTVPMMTDESVLPLCQSQSQNAHAFLLLRRTGLSTPRNQALHPRPQPLQYSNAEIAIAMSNISNAIDRQIVDKACRNSDEDSNKDISSFYTPKALLHPLQGTSAQYPKHKPLARGIQVRKSSKELFGVELVSISGRVFVAFVYQYITAKDFNNELSRQVYEESIGAGPGSSIPTFTETPAYRAGLKFGDRIEAINHASVSGQTEELLSAAKLLLDISSSPDVRVVDQPLHSHYKFTIVRNQDECFGFIYENEQISHVMQGSLAARAGLMKHASIISIDGESTVGFSDEHIIDLLAEKEHFDDHETEHICRITTIPHLAYTKLLMGMTQGIDASPLFGFARHSASASQVIDNDFCMTNLVRASELNQI